MGFYDARAGIIENGLTGTPAEIADALYQRLKSEMPVQVNMTAEDLTRAIREEVPDYSFDAGSEEQQEERKARSDRALKAIATAHCEINKDPKYEDVYWGQDLGVAMDIYRQTRMTEPLKSQLDPFGKNAPDGSDFKDKVYEHFVKNADAIAEEYSRLSDEELVNRWSEINAIRIMADAHTTVEKEVRWPKDKKAEYLCAINPVANICSRLTAKINILASPLGHMVDSDQLLNMTASQQNALQRAAEHIYDTFETEYEQIDYGKNNKGIQIGVTLNNTWRQTSYNIFSADYLGAGRAAFNQEVEDKARIAMGIYKSTDGNDKYPMHVYDLFGNPVTDVVNACQSTGQPVFYISEKNPLKAPVPAFVRDGRTYVGDAALEAYQAQGAAPQLPCPPNPGPYHAGILQSIADFIVELFRRTSARMLHNQELERYNRIAEKNNKLSAIHRGADDIEEILNDLADAAKGRMMQEYNDMSPEEYAEYKQDHTLETITIRAKHPELIQAQPQNEDKKTEVDSSEILDEKPQEKERSDEEKTEDFYDDLWKVANERISKIRREKQVEEDKKFKYAFDNQNAYDPAKTGKGLNVQEDARFAAAGIRNYVILLQRSTGVSQFEKASYATVLQVLDSVGKGELRESKQLEIAEKAGLAAVAGYRGLRALNKGSANKELVEQAQKLEGTDLIRAVKSTFTYNGNIDRATGRDIIDMAQRDFADFESPEFMEQLKTALTEILELKKDQPANEKIKQHEQLTDEKHRNAEVPSLLSQGGHGKG